jgi:hypothetical protein
VRSAWENQQVSRGATLASLRLQMVGLIAELQEVKGRVAAARGKSVERSSLPIFIGYIEASRMYMCMTMRIILMGDGTLSVRLRVPFAFRRTAFAAETFLSCWSIPLPLRSAYSASAQTPAGLPRSASSKLRMGWVPSLRRATMSSPRVTQLCGCRILVSPFDWGCP